MGCLMTQFSIMPRWIDIPIENRPKGFYVYIHRRTLDGTPFYVGKGQGRRGWRPWSRNTHWERCAKKNGITVEVVKDGLSEPESIALEIAMIKKIGFDNLTNISTGGESGATGITPHNIRPVECSNGMVFKSAKEAEEWLRSEGHSKASGSTVTGCCRQRFKSAHGYDWRYVGDDREFNYVSRGERIGAASAKRVRRSDGMEFVSASAAGRYMKAMGITKSDDANVPISSCCKGRLRKAYGFGWEYI